MREFATSILRGSVIEMLERVEGSTVTKNLRVLRETERFSRDELDAFRWRKLRRLLDHAYTNVPFYRRLFDGLGLSPGNIRSPEDFARIPVLTKKVIRENQDELKATSLPPGMKVVQAQTGGTTGEPMKFARDLDCNSFTRAALLRSYMWTGYRAGDSLLFLTGGSLLGAAQTFKQRFGFFVMNYHFMPGFRLTRETLGEYVEVVMKKKVRFMRGYSTLLHHFAELCERAGEDRLRIPAIYPTAEMLTTAQRATIERVFRGSVYDQYGCAEINSIANECPEQKKFHIIEEHVYMEECSVEGFGESSLVLTDLDNYAQPFIRYANGDRGHITETPCACGRNLSVLAEFLGRSSDEIILASGDAFPGVFFHHLFGHFAGVTQFQVVQEKPGELVVKIIKNHRYTTTDESEIKRLVAEHTGIIASIEYVDAIPRSPSGKITSVVSTIGRD